MLRTIRSQIERARVYPDAARRQGMQGIVEVRFRIGPEGSVEAVEIVRSSGHALLDQASIDTVRRAGPYPRVAGWIRIPLAYRLDQ
jgi:protein TonB